MNRKPLIALCLGFFMVIMDVTIVNVALPNLKVELHTTVSWLQWVVDGYTLTFAAFLLMAGYLGDKLGAKRLFQLGIGVFILSSLCCGLASVAWLLTVLRLIQGASAAFMVPTSIALINASFPDQQTRARAIGVWAAMGGIAAAAGPFLGAILTATFDWRAVFFVNVPIGLVCLWLTARYVVSPAGTHIETHFDRIAQILGITTIAALAFALIEAGRFGWVAWPFIGGVVVALIALIGFIKTERNAKHPMLPLSFFRSQHFTWGLLTGFVMTLTLYGELFVLPLYFHTVRGFSILMTGFAIVPLMIMVAIGSYLSGKVVAKVGTKWPIMSGSVMGLLGFLGVLLVVTYDLPYWMLILPFVILGFAMSFILPAATIAVVRAVPEQNAGLASGAFNTFRQIGSLVGVAVFGTIIASATSFVSGMVVTLWISVALFVLLSLAVWRYL